MRSASTDMKARFVRLCTDSCNRHLLKPEVFSFQGFWFRAPPALSAAHISEETLLGPLACGVHCLVLLEALEQACSRSSKL